MVTIIVLLILAGVTIVSLLGDNGIIQKAEDAAIATKKSQVIESVRMDILMAQLDGNLTQEKLEEILGNYGEVQYDDEGNITGIKVEEINEIIPIEDLFTGEIDTDITPPDTGMTAEEIATEILTNPDTYYGKTVTGYTCTNSSAVANWQIFYAGNDFSSDGSYHVYLIADDFIPYANIPQTVGGHSLTQGTSINSAYWNTTASKDYSTGSASITNEDIKKLNNDLFNTKGLSGTHNNMKAVAYMLDTNAWSGYKGEKADYAVGGPSIEMLMKSYSQKHGVDYRAQAILDDSVGYQISNNGGSNWEFYHASLLQTDDSLYVVPYNTNALGYWLASPSAGDPNHLMLVYYTGSVDVNSYISDYSLGFRPLVCLSSDVKFKQLEDGSFEIQ